MPHLTAPDTVTRITHRFTPDLYGQGVDTCSGCGGHRSDRDHDQDAPRYREALEAAERDAAMAAVVPGDFLSYTLVTDSVVVEVVGRTARTLRVRSTRQGDIVDRENRDGNPYPIVWHEAVSDPDAPVRTVRQRKDGSFRAVEWSRLRPAGRRNGVPVTVTDYRF